MLGTGLLMQATTITGNFYAFFAISAVLGLLSGLINILLNILFCKYLGTERASLSFGLSAFFCGLVTLARPAVVGHFRDSKDGSYDGLLTVLGFVSVAAGALWLLEPMLKRSLNGNKTPELKNGVNAVNSVNGLENHLKAVNCLKSDLNGNTSVIVMGPVPKF